MQFIKEMRPTIIMIFFTILLFNCTTNPTKPDNKDMGITVKVVDSDNLSITDVSVHFIYTNWYNYANNKYYKVISAKDDSNVVVDTVIAPSSNRLYQNYPNPFNPVTSIQFVLAKESFVSLIVYDWPNYNQICTLVNQKCFAGCYQVVWNGKNAEDEIMGNGLYPYKLKTDDFEEDKIMCIQDLDMYVLESSNSNYKTDDNGTIEIDYSDQDEFWEFSVKDRLF